MIQAKDISIAFNDSDPNGPMLATFVRTDTGDTVTIPVTLTLTDTKHDEAVVTQSVRDWLDTANGITSINEAIKNLVL